MAQRIHRATLNVDMGEAYGNYSCGPDETLISMIDIANIACGFHAGDPVIMDKTVALCKAHGVKVGAHPGLPDIQGFGRRKMKLTVKEHTSNIIYQVGALQGFLDRHGVALNHVKPHGVLYGMMISDVDVCRAVWNGVPRGVKVFGLAGTNMEVVAKEMGLEFVAEYFGDVNYDSNGQLFIDRKKRPWTREGVRTHVSQQLYESKATTLSGEIVDLPVKDLPFTICCHSDSPGCIEIVQTTRSVIDEYNTALSS